jgi:hypothetical protein
VSQESIGRVKKKIRDLELGIEEEREDQEPLLRRSLSALHVAALILGIASLSSWRE